MIIRIVKLTFDPKNVPAFLDLFEESKETIASYEGIEYLELCKNKNNDANYFTISKWKDEAALNNYRESDFLKKTWHQTKQYFNDKPEAWTLGSLESIGTWQ